MSNDQTNNEQATEVAATPTQQPQTRQERRQERQLERRQKASSNAAPTGLFQKAKGSNVQSNPERVNIIKIHIEEYAKACTIAAGDNKEARLATMGLVSAIRSMFTLSPSELREVFEVLLKTIKEDTRGAFNMGILYRYVNEVKETRERETFIGVMDLMTSYARMHDPSKIRQRKDVDYAVRYVTNEAAAKAFVSMFPEK